MTPLHALLLGILQGTTEFIPVSSSGHLVLVPWLMGWEEPGLAFDTIVHWGTLLAVVGAFWHDLTLLAWSWLRGWRTRSWPDPEGRVAWLLLLGTLPAVVLGLLLEDWFEALFSTPSAVSCFLILTGLLMMVGERLGRHGSGEEQLRWWDALLVGLGQAAAIAPGISRSGTTIASGLLCGMRREAAARFSFLLSIPVILGAGGLQLVRLLRSGQVKGEWLLLVIGFTAAAASGYLCIRILMRYLRHHGLYSFALYCCGVGLVTLWVSFADELATLSQSTTAQIAGLPGSWPPIPLPESEYPPVPRELVLGGPEALRPLMGSLSQAFEAENPQIIVIVDTRAADSSDLTFAHERNTEERAVPIALDALAIIVHASNQLQGLTMLEVQGIFAGRGYDWEPLGGRPGRISVLDQMDGTPSQLLFANRVMKSQRVTPNAILVPNDGSAVAAVASDPLAIAYASVGYLSPGVRPLVIEGVSATPENLAQGTYHLLRPVYLMTAGQPSEQVQIFVDFVLSDEGQSVVGERYGRVSIAEVE